MMLIKEIKASTVPSAVVVSQNFKIIRKSEAEPVAEPVIEQEAQDVEVEDATPRKRKVRKTDEE